MSLSANPYKRKGFIWMRIENNFHMWTKTLKLTSIWKIGLGQLANGFWMGTNDNGNDDDYDDHDDNDDDSDEHRLLL